MRYETRVTAYDMLDSICIAVVTWESEPSDGCERHQVLTLSTTVAGEGISDPAAWTRDALVAILEAL